MIRHGDCRLVLPTLDAESVDACVTDPPYHLTTGKKGGRGFMGQQWDGGGVAFEPETWAAVLRVMKPGAYLVAFGGTRTYHRLACAIEDAGFEIRDQLAWVYGSGFPKGTDKAKIPEEWKGWNTALKPAWEPIVLARKPMIGTLAENLHAHGCGAMNVNGCRIEAAGVGRWPTNLMHDGSEEVLEYFPESAGQQGDVLGTEPSSPTKSCYGKFDRVVAVPLRRDTGSAARFFYCAKADRKDREHGLHDRDQNPGAFQSPNTDRSARNHHPTVKPTALMRWLVRLVTPTGGLVLDPFAGSGSTGRGAILERCRFLGVEQDAEYVEITRARIAAVDAGSYALHTQDPPPQKRRCQ